MEDTRQHRTLAIALLAAAAVAVLICTGCRTEVKVTHLDFVVGPPQFTQENVPWPPVSGGYGYEGYGHFYLVDANDVRGESFSWRDGHFYWADGGLIDPGPYDASGWLGIPDFSGATAKEALTASFRELSGLGWWVRHAYIDSQRPLAVTFGMDEADNGPFVEDILLRQFLYVQARGLSVDKLGIEYGSRPGIGHRDLTPAEGMAQEATKLWLRPPAAADNNALRAAIAARLPGGADHPGYTVRLLEVTTSYLESRRVTLAIALTGDRANREQAAGYAAEVLALVRALNADEGAGIAVLRFDALDGSGTPLVQERWDLDLGRHSSEPMKDVAQAVRTVRSGPPERFPDDWTCGRHEHQIHHVGTIG
jgi:hypothetical protein